MVALKPSSKLPFGRVAVAGLIMLAVSLTLRTSFMVLGGPHLNSGAPQQESAVQSAEQSAVKRFCTPPLAPQGAAAAQGRGSSSGGMARAGSDDSEGSSGSDLNSRSMDGQGAKQDAEGPVTWQEIDRLISQPAQVHGRQKKAGLPANWRSALGHMVNMSPWLPAGLPPSITPEITKWLEMTGRWKAGELSGSNAQLRSPVPSCHYLVDHRRGVIFVRTTKIGGTTLANTLGITNNPVACRMDPKRCEDWCRGRPLCMSYLTDPEILEKVWQKYTVFTFVRNPWSRAISSFHYNNKRAIKQNCRSSFASFAAAPSVTAVVCLQNLKSCCVERFGFVLEHLEPQTNSCIFTEDGLPAVDFIGRSERYDEDFEDLVKLLNSRMQQNGKSPLKIPRVGRLNTRSSSSELDKRKEYAEYYINNSALCNVRSYFADDFELLKFPGW